MEKPPTSRFLSPRRAAFSGSEAAWGGSVMRVVDGPLCPRIQLPPPAIARLDEEAFQHHKLYTTKQARC